MSNTQLPIQNPKSEIQNREVSPAVRRFIIIVDRLTISLGNHWLLCVNLVLALFVGLPALAPVMMHYGWTGPANLIYTVYHFTCHELAYRSFFFFGNQPVSAYTMDQLRASLGVQNEDVITYWSTFIGNAQLGYKMAWCERDAAIYTTVLFGGLLYALVRNRWHIQALDFRVFLLLLVPMAIDGFWQLFTSPVYFFTFLPQHESTWWLRVITGILLGGGAIWLAYPYVQDAMIEMQAQARNQYARARAHEQWSRGS